MRPLPLLDRATAAARARMPAPHIDRLVQFRDVRQSAAKTASAANPIGHRCFLSVSSFAEFSAPFPGEFALYTIGIYANDVTSHLSTACLTTR
jgi:hypothetical protein